MSTGFLIFQKQSPSMGSGVGGVGGGTACVLKPISKKHFYDPLANLFIQHLFTDFSKNHYILL